MDTQSIVIIVGVAMLLIERLFACFRRVKKSKCWGGEIELNSSPSNKSLSESFDRKEKFDSKIENPENAVEIAKVVTEIIHQTRKSSLVDTR